MILFGHILFGTLSMIGTMLLAIGFRNDFASLSGVQKLAIVLSIIGIFATVAMGMFSMGNVISGVLVIGLALIFVGYLAREVFTNLAKNK